MLALEDLLNRKVRVTNGQIAVTAELEPEENTQP